jgi:hypothetical protein
MLCKFCKEHSLQYFDGYGWVCSSEYCEENAIEFDDYMSEENE